MFIPALGADGQSERLINSLGAIGQAKAFFKIYWDIFITTVEESSKEKKMILSEKEIEITSSTNFFTIG